MASIYDIEKGMWVEVPETTAPVNNTVNGAGGGSNTSGTVQPTMENYSTPVNPNWMTAIPSVPIGIDGVKGSTYQPIGRPILNSQVAPSSQASASPAPSSSGTPASNPNPWTGGSGFFQYGHNQYGFINNTGGIDWTTKAPTNKNTVLNWNDIAKWLNTVSQGSSIPAQKAAPAYFQDAQWFKNMADLEYETNLEKSRLEYEKKVNEQKYGETMGGLKDQFMEDVYGTGAQLAGAGTGWGGGAFEQANIKRHSDLVRTIGELNRTIGPLRTQQILAELNMGKDKYAASRSAENLGARERWKALHPGEKPKNATQQGYKQVGDAWYYTDKSGRTVSVGENTPRAVALKRVQGLLRTSVARHGAGSAQARRYREMLAKIRKWEA